MAMNRETKRMLQRQGQLGPDGEQARPSRENAPQRRAPRERVGATTYAREVRGELRKVAWPSREETVRLSLVVLFTLVVLTALVFGLDWAFAKFVFYLFDK